MSALAESALPQLQSTLAPAAGVADIIVSLSWVLFVGEAVIFTCVMGLLGRTLSRPAAGRPVPPILWIVGGGVIFPLLVLVSLFVYSSWRTPAGWWRRRLGR